MDTHLLDNPALYLNLLQLSAIGLPCSDQLADWLFTEIVNEQTAIIRCEKNFLKTAHKSQNAEHSIQLPGAVYDSREKSIVQLPKESDHQQTVPAGINSCSGNCPTNSSNTGTDSSGAYKEKYDNSRDQPSDREWAEQKKTPVEGPYFTLEIVGNVYRVARSQLAPEKRGQESATEIHAYQPGVPDVNWPLTDLERMTGVRPVLRLPETDQKPLNYLVTYGTEETRHALSSFYPVDVLQLGQNNHLEEVNALTTAQQDDNCVICQESIYRFRGAFRTDCQHVFHFPCLTDYFVQQTLSESADEQPEANLKCPMCRRSQVKPGHLLNSEKALPQELLYACEQGLLTVVRVLLEARIDSNAKDQQGLTALHKAAQANNLQIVVMLVSNGADVNQTNSQGLTAVDLASMSGLRPMVEILSEAINVSPVFYWTAYGYADEVEQWINRGEDLNNTLNEEGSTLLHIAAARGHLGIVEQLLDYADTLDIELIDRMNSHRRTPLCTACNNSQTAVVRLLLSRGASPNPATDQENNPLLLSSRRGCLESARVLLAHPTAHFKDEEQIRAVIAAAQHGHHETVKFLMTGIGAPLTQWGGQALLEAARQGHWHVVGTLLNAGVSDLGILKEAVVLTVYNRHPDTAALLLEQFSLIVANDTALSLKLLLHSSQTNQPKTVALLLRNSVSVNLARNSDGATALIVAVDHGHLSVVRVLLESGADVNRATKWYFGAKTFTPLKLAVMNGRNEIVKILLENGAKVLSEMALPQTASRNYQLLKAVSSHNIRKVEVLLEKYSNLNTGNALYYAARYGLLRTSELLHRYGADPNHVRLTEGDTALHGAVKGGSLRLVQFLLLIGANPTAVNVHNERPMDIASSRGNMEAAALLNSAIKGESSAELKNVLTSNVGNALYHAAAHNQCSIVSWLLAGKVDPNGATESSGGMTPMHAAARNNHDGVIRLLLEYGADINKTNSDGETALDVAHHYHQHSAIQILESAGRDLSSAATAAEHQLSPSQAKDDSYNCQ